MILIYASLTIIGFISGFLTLFYFVRKLKAGADKNLIKIIEEQNKEIENLELNHSYLEELLNTK